MVQLKTKLLLLIILLPFVSKSQNFAGNPAGEKWMQINTASSRVIFPKGLDSQANRISNIVSLLDSTTLFSIGDKKRKWDVVLQTHSTEANAYVRLAPVLSELYLVPPQNNFMAGSVRWDDNLIIHEDRHMQQFSNFNKGLTRVFSFLLGQEGQLLANGISIPNYFFEGDAVWQETLVSRQGRGRMPYFFNGVKSLWLQNKNYSWMKLRSGSLRQYIPDHYAVGYPLVAYGYEKYGTDFWRKVTDDAVRFKGLFYSFNKAVEKYSGKTYQQFCTDALQYYKEQTLTENSTAQHFNFITGLEKNNVVDYLYPQFVNDDTLIVTKQSYREVNSFYFLINGKEVKLRVKDYVTDDYFSYSNGKIAYAAYQSDPRRANRNYNVIQLLDIYTGEQKQLTFNSKYFSPAINADGTELLAVKVNDDGSNYLQRLNAATGALITQLPNPENYFFTQTKYNNGTSAVAAVRNVKGEMAMVKVDLVNGQTETLTTFSYNTIGYPFVRNDTVYFSMTDNGLTGKNSIAADRIFAVSLTDKKLFRLTDNANGVYHPVVNNNGKFIISVFTADGYRLSSGNIKDLMWKEVVVVQSGSNEILGATAAASQRGAAVLYQLSDVKHSVEKYKKSFQLFNFHSARPLVSDPEYGYTFYSDNILNSFSNSVNYTYNRNEQSHTVGYDAVFAQWFPWLNISASYSANRNFYSSDGKHIQLNSTKLNPGISIPLSFIKGRTFKYLNVGIGYNLEKIMYTGDSKRYYKDQRFDYGNAFFSFTNTGRLTKQSINPAWAQSISINYRDAFSLVKSKKLVGKSSLYFPGILRNQSIVLDAAFQSRDTISDIFSDIFPYSRGYQSLSEKRMYKLGVNYHLPLLYPDWGFGNIIYFQRIRANAFYDDTHVKALLRNGSYLDFNNRSTGVEMYFDTKLWNSLPVSFGLRYSHLLDKDFLNPGAVNRWEILLPINIIPN